MSLDDFFELEEDDHFFEDELDDHFLARRDWIKSGWISWRSEFASFFHHAFSFWVVVGSGSSVVVGSFVVVVVVVVVVDVVVVVEVVSVGVGDVVGWSVGRGVGAWEEASVLCFVFWKDSVTCCKGKRGGGVAASEREREMGDDLTVTDGIGGNIQYSPYAKRFDIIAFNCF